MFQSEQLFLFEHRPLSYIGISARKPYDNRFPKKREDIKGFLWRFVDINSPKTDIINTNNLSDLDKISPFEFNSIVSLSKINNTRCITKFLNAINRRLDVGGIYILCAETLEQRRNRIFAKYPPFLFHLYYFCDFIINRVFPKLFLTKKIYFFFRKGNNRILSLPEILGRIVYSGFKIIDSNTIDGLTYLVVEKEKEPLKEPAPVNDMILKIRKTGKDGKLITIYKLRTMYAFSQYIQQYVYENNNLKDGGKFNNDFRITGWGRILRKYFIDELPMIFNILKGDLKLVGLRPLTEHYLSLYNKKLINKRMTVKPGLIPPFYKDMPNTLEEIMESEERYIDAYMKHPFKTDMKYFYYAVVNIIFKGVRSC